MTRTPRPRRRRRGGGGRPRWLLPGPPALAVALLLFLVLCCCCCCRRSSSTAAWAFVINPPPSSSSIPRRRSRQRQPLRPLLCEVCGSSNRDRNETTPSSLFSPTGPSGRPLQPPQPLVGEQVKLSEVPGVGGVGGGSASDDDGEKGDPAAGAMINFIKGYKQLVSPLLPPACRFFPTCSEYAVEAIERFGPARGAVLTAWRILRCNPFGGRGYDPPVWPPPPWNAGSTSQR